MRSGVDTVWCPPRSKWTRSQMSEAVENLGSGRGPGARRRRWSDAEKRRIVAESYQPGGFCVGCGAAQRRERQPGVQLAAPVSRAGWRDWRLGAGGCGAAAVGCCRGGCAGGGTDGDRAGRWRKQRLLDQLERSSTSLRRARPRTSWRPNRRRRGPRRSRGLRAASRSRRTCRASAWWCRRRLPARAADWRSCRRSART